METYVNTFKWAVLMSAKSIPISFKKMVNLRLLICLSLLWGFNTPLFSQECNEVETRNTSAGSNIYEAYCGGGNYYPGPEIRKVGQHLGGQYHVKLTNLTADLDLFLVRNSDPTDCVESSTAGGTSDEEIFIPDLPAGNYTLIIDGYGGVTGSYTHLYCPPIVSEPDYTSISLSGPTTASLGEDIQLNVQIQNIGNASGDGSNGREAFWLADQPSFGGNYWFLTTTNTPSLAANAIEQQQPTVTIPTDINPGIYYILHAVDTDDVIDESDEGNNLNNYQLTIEEPAPSLNCASAIPLQHVAKYQGNFTNASNNVTDYGRGDNFTGREVLFRIDLPNALWFQGNVYFDLKGDAEKLILLNSCDPIEVFAGPYIDKGTANVISGVSPGTYYIVVEGPSDGSDGNFELTVRRDHLGCTSAQPITVGQPTGPGSTAYDYVNHYCGDPNATPLTGNEAIFELTNWAGGDFKATLSDMVRGNSGDAWTDAALILLTDCQDPATCVVSPVVNNGASELVLNVSNLPAGDYTIVVDGVSPEPSPEFKLTIEEEKPDYQPTAMTGPATANPGQGVTMQISLKNNGSVDGNGNGGKDKYYISSTPNLNASNLASNATLLKDYPTDNIPAGVENSYTGGFDIPSGTTSGQYYIYFFHDADNKIDESNENNNVISWPITIEATAQKPDYTITAMSVLTSPIIPGESFSIDATYKNEGNADYDGTRGYTYFYLSDDANFDETDTYLKVYYTEPLNVGQIFRANFSMVIPDGINNGIYYVIMYVDKTNIIDESNEDNNTRAVQITVGESLSCDNPVNLTIDQTYSGNTADGANNFIKYNNDDRFNHTGPEVVHKIDWPGGVMDVLIDKVNVDLDVILLNACNPSDYIEASNRAFPIRERGYAYVTVLLNPGTYYIIVDGWEGAVGTYDLTVSKMNESTCNENDENNRLLDLAQSQGLLECDTEISPLERHYLQQFEEEFQRYLSSPQASSREMLNFPITVYFGRRSDGSGGIEGAEQKLANSVANLNTIFAPANISFFVCGVNEMRSDELYNLEGHKQYQLIQQYYTPNTINLYVPGSYKCTEEAIGGYAKFPAPGNPDVIVIGRQSFTDNVLVHEMGHYFNLYHTFDKTFGAELVDGSNCGDSGDLLCDTPADPGLRGQPRNQIFDPQTCTYIGTFVDANGQAYSPLEDNLMSYNHPVCLQHFTPQQYSRMAFAAQNLRSYLSCTGEQLPDYQPTDFVARGGATTLQAGGTLVIDLKIKNNGSVDGLGNGGKDKYYLNTTPDLNGNPTFLRDFETADISANSEFTVNSGPLTIPESTSQGTYYIVFSHDADDKITESNEDNNIAYLQITVIPSGSGLSVDFTADKSSICQGENVQFTSQVAGISVSDDIVYDQSGNGNNGQLLNFGAVPFVDHAGYGKALAFDGDNDYVELPENLTANLDQFTFEAKFFYEGGNIWQRIFDFGAGQPKYIFLTAKPWGHKPKFAITKNSFTEEESVSSPEELTPNQWYHFAVTLDGNSNTDNAKLYINGELKGTNTFSLKPSDLGNLNQNWLGRSQFPDPYLQGQLDEVRIWRTARTEQQILAYKDQALGGNEDGLVAYYDFDRQGGGANYAWRIEKGGNTVFSSAEANPSFTFSEAGTYRVSLTVTSGGQTASEVKNIVVDECNNGFDPAPALAGVIYGTNRNGQSDPVRLVTIDPSTAKLTNIGTITDFETGNPIGVVHGLAVGAQGELYGTTYKNGGPWDNGRLLRIDASTGKAVFIGGDHGTGQSAIAFDDNGTLWSVSWSFQNKDVNNINISTGAVDLVSQTLVGPWWSGMAKNPQNGNIFVVDLYRSSLWEINPSTGNASFFLDISSGAESTGYVGDMFFDEDGNLFLTGGKRSPNLIKVNLSTGTAELVAAFHGEGAPEGGISAAVLGNYSEGATEPDWPVTVTPDYHIVIVPSNAEISLEGSSIASGDYIGAFYDDNGTLKCAGKAKWTGQNTSITLYGDDATTDHKEGFGAGESFQWKLWKASSDQELYGTATYQVPAGIVTHTGQFAVNGVSQLSRLRGATQPPQAASQTITLEPGWNYISSYIKASQSDMASIFNTIQADIVIVKNGKGDVYMPSVPVNGIGSWNVVDGYQVKLNGNSARQLTISGQKADLATTTISFSEGHNLFAYLRETEQSVQVAMAPIASEIDILTDEKGRAYIPSLNINNIGNMKPGKGYWAKMKRAVNLNYNARIATPPANMHTAQIAPNQYRISRRGSFHATVILDTKELLAFGDEVGIFDEKGNLVGAATYEDHILTFPIWGDDPTTDEVDGLLEGATFEIRVWSKTTGTEESYIFNANVDTYTHNSLIEAALLRTTDLNTSLEVNSIKLYPNPTRDNATLSLTLKSQATVEAILFDLAGKRLLDISQEKMSAGSHEWKVNTTTLPSGLYHCRILVDGVTHNIPFSVVK